MLIQWARSRLGCPYIFGAAGQKCTPAYRQSVMKNKPLYADAIRDNCPVLSGKQPTCAGCKYEGKPSYDCRGLTRKGIEAVAGKPIMGAGATSQWDDDSNWIEKGGVNTVPPQPCIVFVQKGSTMSHTGIYTGTSAIHASGHKTGVIESPLPGNWTHYAIPVGLEGDIQVPDGYMIRRRDKGEKVKQLQIQLQEAGYKLPIHGADGDFGAETLSAVEAFQRDNNLPLDGVWDSECQARLEERLAIQDEPDESEIAFLVAFKNQIVALIDARINALNQV